MISFFRKILSAKYAGLLILVICITAKSLLICYYSYIGRDKMYHLSASYNLLHGKGWTNSFYYSDDLSKEINEPFCLWPPGYGLVVAPVEYLVNDDLHRSTDLAEIGFFIIFILLCRGILSTQQMNRRWLNASTILLTFFSHDFIEVSLGTDLPGLCYMLAFFYCSILLWKIKRSSRGILLGIIAAICLFMAGFTRYMYVPVAAFTSVAMIIAAYWKRNRAAVGGYWTCLILSSALLAAAAFYQGAMCADPFYIGTDKKSVFTENLYYWHPAALGAFLNLEVYATVMSRLTKTSFLFWRMFFNWINLVVYAGIAIAAIRFLPVLKRADAKAFPFFKTIGFILSAAIIGELAVLSLTNSAKYSLNGEGWTFIMEGRYHAFAVVFLQLFFLLELSRIRNLKTIPGVKAFVMGGLFLLLCVNSLHQVYFTVKVAAGFRQMKGSLAREQDYDFMEDYTRKMLQENPGKDILVTSSDAYYPMMGSVLGAKGVKDYVNSHSIAAAVQRPSVLLVAVMKPQLAQYRSFIEMPGVQLVKEINGTYIYRQDIIPAQQ